MRIAVSFFLLLAMVFNSGCAIVEKETTNRGGYLDYVIDEHWMKADSKGMRALRAFAIQVSLARIASVSAKNESDRQLLAIRIGALTKRFLPIYACAFDTNPLGVPGAENDPCFYFDSAMVDYSTGLFDLAMVALPIDDAKRLLTAVTGSAVNPINIADLLDTLLQIGKDALKYGRVVGALYRDTVELEVQLWLATPAIDNRPAPFRVIEAHVAALREIYARRNDDMPAWLGAIAALRSQGLEPMAQRRFFVELAGLMNYICNLITKDTDALPACKAGLPTTMPAPMSALRTSGSISLGGGITTTKGRVTSVGDKSSGKQISVSDKGNNAAVGGKGNDKTVAKSTTDILLDLMRSGDGATKKATRAKLQGFLSEDSMKPLVAALPEPDRSNPVIESIVVNKGPEFDVVRGRLIAIARTQSLLK